jgi:hypothetical protein
MEVTLLKEIDLSDETIKEYFEFPDDYEVTEEDRLLYFDDYISLNLREEIVSNMDIINCEYYISNP